MVGLSKSNSSPVTPSLIREILPPLARATTGVPICIASRIELHLRRIESIRIINKMNHVEWKLKQDECTHMPSEVEVLITIFAVRIAACSSS